MPSLGARILRGNKEDGASGQINLRGLAMGNPLVDAANQYPSYAPYALEHGIISQAQADTMATTLPGCIELIKQCSQRSVEGWHACLEAHVLCQFSQLLPAAASGVNPYDVRLPCGDSPLCYDMRHIERFLAQKDVREALGVHRTGSAAEGFAARVGLQRADSRTAGHAPHHWHECNMHVNSQLSLSGDWFLDFATDLPQLLAAQIRVLVYAGDQDLICNHYGQAAWLAALEWPGQKSFAHARNSTWFVHGSTPRAAGSVRSAQGLTYLVVKGAGHMVPMDKPAEALQIMLTFMANQTFEARNNTHEHEHESKQKEEEKKKKEHSE